jgi:hypothetical protein
LNLFIFELIDYSTFEFTSPSFGYLRAFADTLSIYFDPIIQVIMNKNSENRRFGETYPAFTVPDTIYELIFVNKYMTMEVMDKVLNHISDCYQYSVDTESEMSNNELSIIQVHTIPRTLPSQLLIIELSQLPNRESYLFKKIKEIFRLIFRSHNEIYSWGDMNKEMEPAKKLFACSITSELMNIQPHFSSWYEWARTQCRVQGLIHQVEVDKDVEAGQQNPSLLPCSCHQASPYHQQQLWSLQKAFIYGCNLFIDKTNTLAHWSHGLTPGNSSLSHARRLRMIHYAIHDVMAVTYLIRPITEYWSFKKIKEIKIEEIFIRFQSTKLPPLRKPPSRKKTKNINVQKLSKILTSIDPDLEPISSDDEIYLNQLIEPVVNVHHLEDQINDDDIAQDVIRNIDDDVNVELQIEGPTMEIIMNDDDQMNSVNNHSVVVDGMNNPTEHHQQRIKKQRSLQGKQKKNRKRNNKLRLIRYKYYLTRSYYYRFKPRTAKKVLRYYGVHYRHIKFEDDRVVIGVKSAAARRDYEETLPYNCFNGRNYWRFRN